MNENIVKGNWGQLKGKMKEQWGKLTDDELDVIEGKRDKAIGKLREKYGWSEVEAERELSDFERRHATAKTP